MSIEKFLLEGEKAESFTIEDVVKHGCSGGTIPSLIYYYDTIKFHDEHETWIWQQLYQHANNDGLSILQYISRLNGGKDVGSMTQLKNLLSWWAAEVAAQYILNEREERDACTG
tara:strand:+ start:69 stop:410 length:342 start_codon:yes stop_codon:yes gene_type:complete